MKELEAKDDQGTSKSGSSSRAYNELFFAWQVLLLLTLTVLKLQWSTEGCMGE